MEKFRWAYVGSGNIAKSTATAITIISIVPRKNIFLFLDIYHTPLPTPLITARFLFQQDAKGSRNLFRL